MANVLCENLEITFDSAWNEEIKPELAKIPNLTGGLEEPTLNLKHSAYLLNTTVQKFKKFLVDMGFVSKFNLISDDMLLRGWMKQLYRRYPHNPETPLIRITKNGFVFIGALFINWRKNH